MKRLLTIGIILSMMLVSSGCEEESSTSILLISSISQTSAPFGDIQSSDGTIPDDTVEIIFNNELRNPAGLGDNTQGDIIIDSVTVSFNRIDGGSDVPNSFRSAITLRVPANGQASLQDFVLLPATSKLEFPLSDLIFFGFERSTNFVAITMDAIVEVTGKTVEGDPVFVRGNLTIEVTNRAD